MREKKKKEKSCFFCKHHTRFVDCDIVKKKKGRLCSRFAFAKDYSLREYERDYCMSEDSI